LAQNQHVWVIGVWDLDIVCYLLFGAWNLLSSITPLYLNTQEYFCRTKYALFLPVGIFQRFLIDFAGSGFRELIDK
jgi:hypothetical protein